MIDMVGHGVWMRWAGDHTELMTETPKECGHCHRMTCFFENRDGETKCTGCDGKRNAQDVMGKGLKQYVQHISGQGEKWEVSLLEGDRFLWIVQSPPESTYNFFLPKSEYRLCDPPEQWEDVTAERK